MSADLIWQLVKDNNAFLVKRGRTARLGAVQFSKEPGNLMNVNSFKYSGIAPSRTVVLTSGSEDVTLTTKVTLSFSSHLWCSHLSPGREALEQACQGKLNDGAGVRRQGRSGDDQVRCLQRLLPLRPHLGRSRPLQEAVPRREGQARPHQADQDENLPPCSEISVT